MTKRSTSSAKNKSGGGKFSLLTLVLLFLAAAAIYLLDLEAQLGLPEFEEEYGLPDIHNKEDAPAGGGTVSEEVPPETAGDWYAVYFTQPVNSNDPAVQVGSVLEAALIQEIDAAQNSIDAALFELDVPAVTEAFTRALGRGVKVRIVFDDEHGLDDPGSTAQEVIDAGAEYRSDERSALMHNKYIIFDGAAVWTGATNLTRNGVYNNNNNAILIRSQALAQNFTADFEEMFTDGVFNRRDDTRPVPNRTISIGDSSIETYFSPEDGPAIEARLAELVNSAQSSIRVMAFSFTLESVGSAIRAKMAQGVTFEGVFETTGSLQGQMKPLACAGANVVQDGNPSIMHHKVFIIDEQTVALGSFNFSASARDNNSENMLVIANPEIAAAYTAEWHKVYAQGRTPSAADLAC